MFFKHLLVGLFELVLMTFMCGLLIYIIYRVFIKATPEIDMEKELKNGNVAVGILVASIMVSAGIMVQKGLVASVGMFKMSLFAPSEFTLPVWQTALVILGHLILSLAVTVFVLSMTLRLFAHLVRRINPELRAGRLGLQLVQGNIAVGLVLSAVMFMTTLYVSEGVSALTKALVVQPSIGTIQIMK
jgi:uncharacterized membrane protein YjfL (UPF0719 family)